MKWFNTTVEAPGIWPEQAEHRTTLANPDWTLIDSLTGGARTYAGEKVTVEKALELAAVRSAVAMISQAVGGLPLKVYRIEDDDQRIEAKTHRTYRMLHDKPNPLCTANTFWTTVAAHLLIWEQSYLFKDRDEQDEVESLWHVDPTAVAIKLVPSGKLFVIENPDARPVRTKKNYTEEDILHIVGFSTSGYAGQSRILEAKQTLGAAIARAKFEGGFYKRGMKSPAWAGHPGHLGEKGVKNVSDQLQKWHGGVDQMHKIPILEEGMTLNEMSVNLEDMQFAQMAEQSRTEIAVLFNIPPAYLGAKSGDSLTYATTESNQIQFAQMAVLPVANTIAKALSSDPSLLPRHVMYCEFVLEGLLRADMKTRMEYWKGMKEVLGLDPEYIAARENIPKDALKEPEEPPVMPGANGGPPDPAQNPAMMAQAAKVAAVS